MDSTLTKERKDTDRIPVRLQWTNGRWAAALLLTALLLGGCSFFGPPKATLQMMDEAEARWQAAPVQNYAITVEVDRPDDRRRTTVSVEAGQIVEGVVSYWDFERQAWRAPYALNQDQAFPFTVPGLFDMVRGELENSGRDEVRVEMGGEPPFPQRILLGPVVLDGQTLVETMATVTVRQLTPQ